MDDFVQACLVAGVASMSVALVALCSLAYLTNKMIDTRYQSARPCSEICHCRQCQCESKVTDSLSRLKLNLASEVIRTLIEHNISSCPVLQDGHPFAFIDVLDITSFVVDVCRTRYSPNAHASLILDSASRRSIDIISTITTTITDYDSI